MLILSEFDVAATLSMRDAIEVVQSAFVEHANGRAAFPLRSVAWGDEGLLGAMPGSVRGEKPALGAKLVTVFPKNSALGKHTHNAVIALFSSETGEPLALLDGRYITEIRTAAASAIASHALARSGFSAVAILGTGVQARAHIEAMCTLKSVESIRVWGRDESKASELAAHDSGGGITIKAVASVEDACRGVDVVCTVTASADPILDVQHVAPGIHINAVGACTPRARELTSALVGRSRIVCDSLEGAMTEAGDIVLAIRDGALDPRPDIALLGDILAGKVAGRSSAGEITLFESLGVAIEDLACAEFVYERVKSRGGGTEVNL
ncbi:MAG TPA: ornithine cyclodeaminase family protein [Candidatus Eremiobacteraceae bacterium]